MKLQLNAFLNGLENFKIEEKEGFFKITAIRGSKKVTKIPKEMSNKLAYLVGAIVGDGSLSKTFGKGHGIRYRLIIDSITKEILVKIGQILRKEFGLKTKIKRTKRAHRIEFKSKPFVLFMNQIFEVPIGKKSFKTKIPLIIKKDKKLTYAFLSGLIDTDFGNYGRTMGISNRSKGLVDDLKEFLLKEGIDFKTKIYDVNNLPAYHLWLNRKDIEKLIYNSESQFKLQNKYRKQKILSKAGMPEPGKWARLKIL